MPQLSIEEQRRVHLLARQWLSSAEVNVDAFLAAHCLEGSSSIREATAKLIVELGRRSKSPGTELADLTTTYRLERMLGSGGTADVFAAINLRLNRQVAIKVFRTPYSAWSGSLWERFEAEIRAAVRVTHPNIVSLLDSGLHREHPAIVWELIDGSSLESRSDNPLQPESAARMLTELSDAVATAHAAGIVHRDLKPANVLLDAEGRAKIVDFGIARDTDAQENLTTAGQIQGTPAWMAPEQASGERESIGPACDIYSLGALLYFLLTGRPPFSGASPAQILRSVIHDVPAVLPVNLPRDLRTICLKCLEKRPAQRYTTASELHQELQRFLDQKPILARPNSSVERLLKLMRRKPLQTAIVAAILAGTATTLWFAVSASRYAASSDANAKAESTQRQRAEKSERRQRILRISQQHARVLEQTQKAVVPMGTRALINAEQPPTWDARYLMSALQPQMRMVRRLRLSDWAVVAAAMQPGSEILVTSDAAGGLFLVDTNDWTSRSLVNGHWSEQLGRHLCSLEDGGQDCRSAIAWCPDGAWFVTVSLKGQVEVRSASGVTKIARTFPERSFQDVAVSRDGTRILAGDANGWLHLLSSDVSDSASSVRLTAAVNTIASMESGDGWLVGTEEGAVTLLRGRELGVAESIVMGSAVRDLKIEGERCWIATEDGRIHEASAADLRVREIYQSQDEQIAIDAIAVSTDAVVSAGRTGRVAVWDREGHQLRHSRHTVGTDKELAGVKRNRGQIPMPLKRRAAWALHTEEPHRLLIAGEDGYLQELAPSNRVADQSQRQLKTMVGPSPSVAFSRPSDDLLWCRDASGTLSVIDVAGDRVVARCNVSTPSESTNLVALGNGAVATTTSERKPALWNCTNNNIVPVTDVTFETHSQELLSLAVTSDDRMLVSVDTNACLILWDAQSGKIVTRDQISTELGHPLTGAVAFSADDEFLAACGHSQICRVYRLNKDRSELERIPDMPFVAGRGATSIVWNPALRGQLIVGDDLPRYTVFDVGRDRDEEFKPSAKARPVAGVSTRNGDRLILIEQNGLIRVHDTEFMADVLQLPTAIHAPADLALNSTDSILAVATAQGTIECIRVAPLPEPLDPALEDRAIADSERMLVPPSDIFFRFDRRSTCLRDDGTLFSLVISQPRPKVRNRGVPLLVVNDGTRQWIESPGKSGNMEFRSVPVNGAVIALDDIGQPAIACRVARPGETAYEGDAFLIRRTRRDDWSHRKILQGGNSCFYPFLFSTARSQEPFDSLLHFSFANFRLQLSTGGSDATPWRTSNIASVRHGYYLEAERGSDGKVHCLYRSDRSDQTTESEYVYASLAKNSVKHTSLPADRRCAVTRIGLTPDGDPLVMTSLRSDGADRIVSYVSRLKDGKWSDVTQLPMALTEGVQDMDVTSDGTIHVTALNRATSQLCLGQFDGSQWRVMWSRLPDRSPAAVFAESFVSDSGSHVVITGCPELAGGWLSAFRVGESTATK